MPVCDVCTGSTRELFIKGGYSIFGCGNCGFRFVEFAFSTNHVEQTYADEYFFGGGSGYPDYLKESDLLHDHGRRCAAMLKRYLDVGSVLDVGAAAGFFLNGMVESGWRGAGIEPNTTMAAYARSHLGLNVRASSLEEFHSDTHFDLITMVQMMCHFVDPVAAFRAAARLTRPEGWWLIETWNPNSLTARLFGKRWHAYAPPSAIRWFTPFALGTLASRFGFKEVTRGRVRKRIKGAHAKAILRLNLADTPGRILLPALNLVPENLTLPYPAEDVYWVLYRRALAHVQSPDLDQSLDLTA